MTDRHKLFVRASFAGGLASLARAAAAVTVAGVLGIGLASIGTAPEMPTRTERPVFSSLDPTPAQGTTGGGAASLDQPPLYFVASGFIGGEISSLGVGGERLYTVAGPRVDVIDVASNPGRLTGHSAPRSDLTPADRRGATLAVSGNGLYVPAFPNLHRYDISQPDAPRWDRSVRVGGVIDLSASSRWLVTLGNESRAFTLPEFEAAEPITRLGGSMAPRAVAVDGNLAYVLNERLNVVRLDVRGHELAGIHTVATELEAVDVAADDGVVALVGAGLWVGRLDDQGRVVSESAVGVPEQLVEVIVRDGVIFALAASGNLHVFAADPGAPSRLAGMTADAVGLYDGDLGVFLMSRFSDAILGLAIDGGPLSLTPVYNPPIGGPNLGRTGSLLAVGRAGHVALVDASDPVAPRTAGALVISREPQAAIAGLHLGDGWLTVSAGDNLWLADVTDPSAPQEVERYRPLLHAQGMAVVDDVALVADGEGGLSAVDLAARPLTLTDRIQVLQHASGIAADGPRGVLVGEPSLQALDLTDPRQPRPAASVPNLSGIGAAVQGHTAIVSVPSPTPEGGVPTPGPSPTPQQSHLVVDLSDPDDPRVKAPVGTAAHPRIYMVGPDRAFLLGAPGSAPILLDVTDPDTPQVRELETGVTGLPELLGAQSAATLHNGPGESVAIVDSQGTVWIGTLAEDRPPSPTPQPTLSPPTRPSASPDGPIRGRAYLPRVMR